MLNKVQKFFSLSSLEQKMFVQAFFICGFVRIIVSLLPLRWYVKIIGEQGKDSASYDIAKNIDDVRLAVKSLRRAMKYLPGKTKCLARAVSLKIILRKRGILSTLYLGVAKDCSKTMVAHAWLRCGSEIITGKEEMQKYVVVSIFT